MLEVPLTEALRFASTEPARFLGLDATHGRLAPGYRADMVAFDPDGIRIHETWVAGAATDAAASIIAEFPLDSIPLTAMHVVARTDPTRFPTALPV